MVFRAEAIKLSYWYLQKTYFSIWVDNQILWLILHLHFIQTWLSHPPLVSCESRWKWKWNEWLAASGHSTRVPAVSTWTLGSRKPNHGHKIHYIISVVVKTYPRWPGYHIVGQYLFIDTHLQSPTLCKYSLIVSI